MMEDWQTQAARKRATQAQSIPPDWLLPPSAASPSRAADRVDDVRDVPRISGKLAELELEITDTLDAAAVLDKLAKREWSALEVATAFCKRAAIAQQLVRLRAPCLADNVTSADRGACRRTASRRSCSTVLSSGRASSMPISNGQASS